VGVCVGDPARTLWTPGGVTSGATSSTRACPPPTHYVNSAVVELCWGTVYYQESCVRGSVYQSWGGDVRLECLLGDWPVTMPVLTSGTARQRETEDGHLVEPGFPSPESFVASRRFFAHASRQLGGAPRSGPLDPSLGKAFDGSRTARTTSSASTRASPEPDGCRR